MNPTPHRTALLVASLSAVLGTREARAQLNWSFDNGTAGWSITDFTCGNYQAPLGTFDVNWFPTNGDVGGHISRNDPSSNCFFFSAPTPSLGNLTRCSGGTLHFSLKSTHRTWAEDNVVIFKGANNVLLLAQVAPLPLTAWSRYHIPIAPASFRRGSRNGPVPTQPEFDAVLTNVTNLWIAAEYGSEVEETTSLDSVRLGCACIADFNCDGAANSQDFFDFLASFFASDPAADTNADDTINSQDFFDFLAVFFSGC